MTASSRTRAGLALVAALGAGALFGVGLAVAGMTRPTKVFGFLDLLGRWDPTLVFVMAGAIAVHALAYRALLGRTAPLLAAHFVLPTRRDLDARLIAGAALFGVGWGLGGICPGPGVTALASGSRTAAVFVATMLVAMRVVAWLETARVAPEATASTAPR